jgi:hypothetical protein
MEFKLSTPLVLIIGGANVNEQQSSAMPDQRLRGLARLVRTLTKLLVKTDKFYMHPWSLSVRAWFRWLDP